jgi:DNA-binding CsgD family transcriptional regulator
MVEPHGEGEEPMLFGKTRSLVTMLGITVLALTARRAATAVERLSPRGGARKARQPPGIPVRPRDPDGATAFPERGRAIAVRYDPPIRETQALVRLCMDDALRTGDLDRVEQVRRQAFRIGAVTVRYQADVNLTLHLVLRGDFDAAAGLSDQVLAATTRLKLVEITPLVLVVRAVLAGHRGRRAELRSAVSQLHAARGDRARHAPRIHGLAGVFCALLEEDRPLATEEMAAALRADEANPATFPLTGELGMDLLLRALSGTLTESHLAAVTAAPASELRWDKVFTSFARAVLAGRAGHREKAAAAVESAMTAAAPYPMARNLGLRLIAERAMADGWGTPREWLHSAERYFRDERIPAVADACRTLSGREDRNPGQALSAGVTRREREVLRLVGQRLRNREIADRLQLSERTVETHVSSLLAKTGLPNRIELSKVATKE